MGYNTKNNKERKIEYTHIFTVNHSDELLEFLLKKCKTSRNNVKSLLTNHMVLVNGIVVTKYNYMLAKDDEVKITKRPQVLEKKVIRKEKKKFYTFTILYEDEDFIAIDKPFGLLSVENEKDDECAYKYVNQYLADKNPTLRAFQLHRIDKETSGVLVFTKNVKLHSMLKLKWNEYVKTRGYIAIVEGRLDKKEDTIISYLMENQNNMVYSTTNKNGQKAITNYKVIKENNNYSMLNINILTGRKNQIRVHMQALGHPIIGDTKYGHTKNPLNRLGLHANILEFIHPLTKELIRIEAPIPGSFRSLFDTK